MSITPRPPPKLVPLGGRGAEELASEKLVAANGVSQTSSTTNKNKENIHNSTIYRWNRPCYGISEGKAHLRIENRIFPSGPSLIDEMANAAFWLGLMNGFKDEVKDVTQLMTFDHAKTNFANAAQHGLDAKFTWFNNKKISQTNLDRLVRQEKAQQLRDAKDAADRANIQNVQNYTGRELSGYRMSRPASERNYTGGSTNSNPSARGAQDSFSNRSGMGRTGYQEGGLASMFTRRR